MVTADLHGTSIYGRLDVEVQGKKITGEYFGDKFEGSLDGSAIQFVAKDSSGGTSKVDAALRAACYRARWLKPMRRMKLIRSGTHSSRLRSPRTSDNAAAS